MAEMDDLEADIRAAAAETSKPAETVAEPAVDSAPEPVADAKPDAGERARDEHGRFAKQEAAKELKAGAVEQPQVPDAPQAQSQNGVQNGTVSAIPPPQSWKGSGKVAWDRLPPAVQKELSEDYTRISDTQARLDRLDAAIGKDRAMNLAATYGSVERGIENLFAISEMATKNPTGFVLWFAQQRGINLAQMVGQPQAAQQAPQAPDPVMQRIAALENGVNNWLQQQQGAQTQALQSEINAFASDPAHPYFNDVRADMAALIQQGRAKDLKQAYDMAVWAHPEIRQTLIESQVKQQSSQAADAAKQARAASVSVSGSPAGANVPDDKPDETLEQTLRRVQQKVLSA